MIGIFRNNQDITRKNLPMKRFIKNAGSIAGATIGNNSIYQIFTV